MRKDRGIVDDVFRRYRKQLPTSVSKGFKLPIKSVRPYTRTSGDIQPQNGVVDVTLFDCAVHMLKSNTLP